MRRGVWVSFCKIATVSFRSARYKSDGLYCRMVGTPSSPILFFYKSREKVEKKIESREVEINIKYKINITIEKIVEIAGMSGKDCARGGKKRSGVR